jgi:hypothetical protein
MTNLLEKIRQLFHQSKTESTAQKTVNSASNHPEPIENQDKAAGTSAALNAEIVKNLMALLEHTHEGMYSCEETYALLDEYVDLISDSDNEEAAALMPYVKSHLDKCPDCHEVYETLLNIVESEPPSTEPAS